MMARTDDLKQSTTKLKMFLVACTVVAAALVKIGAPLFAVAAGLGLAAFMTWRRWTKV
jgi:hypothetical protein